MKYNFFSITFWFNIFDNHTLILDILKKEFKEEYEKFNLYNETENITNPLITAFNNKEMTNILFSKINFQYNMDKVSLDKLPLFKEKTLKIFEILTSNNIEIIHTAILINGEIIDDDALKSITKNTITEQLYNEDLVDITLKLGKKHEDLFYKIITLLNKKQIKLPRKIDDKGRLVPIPLISWNGALVENDMIDFSYEINDKYSFDFTKNYHTTEFYLNKMFYILIEEFKNDIDNLIQKGNF